MKIAIGADHRGYAMKEYLKKKTHIDGHEITWLDKGAFTAERSDYPVFARIVAESLSNKHETTNNIVDAGVLICGTGTGMAIAANRYPGVYAAVVWNKEVACSGREDDNINVLVFPANYLSHEYAFEILRAWLLCRFKEERYAQRLTLIDQE